MKPVRLTIQAFGPYAGREVIDFRNAVEAGLFGVYGQTGSGKSTIFSAMTFALFGKAAKSEQEAASLRSDHAEPGVLTEVEFVFDVGGKRFVVLRRPEQKRPKRRGDGEIKEAHEAFLFDATSLALEDINTKQRGKIIAEKKVADVEAAISDILGYRLDQFRQIVLLPQGRFETFLAAKTKHRLAILRDLFDVSLYRGLMDHLKGQADHAEKSVRAAHELHQHRLSEEGFESADALAAGIEEAKALYTRLLKDEKTARKADKAARDELRIAQDVDTKFKEAEDAQTQLVKLQVREDDIARLQKRVELAEKARYLLDAEQHVHEVLRESEDAKNQFDDMRALSSHAEETFKAAALSLKKEEDRASELDELRRRLSELQRYSEALEKASDHRQKVKKAEDSARQAIKAFNDAQQDVKDIRAVRLEKNKTLKTARQSEARRRDMKERLAKLSADLLAAQTYQKAEQDVKKAQINFERQKTNRDAAEQTSKMARYQFEKAERNFSAAQAQHLASKLETDMPCPVCGAKEHPAPATGTIENASLDRACHEAKDALQQADEIFREAAEKLARTQGALKERKDHLTRLARPADSVVELIGRTEEVRKTLDQLGPVIAIEAEEDALDQIDKTILTMEASQNKLREAADGRRRHADAEKTRLEERLSAVPEPLRILDVLTNTQAETLQALEARELAKREAAEHEKRAREAALVAQKDCEAAGNVISACRKRHDKAVSDLNEKLSKASMSEEEFRVLKPAIVTIETDRQAVAEYGRQFKNAQETAKIKAEAVAALVRPDLDLLQEKQGKAADNLTEATERRTGAANDVDRLVKLSDSLTETLRRVDALEEETGPVRALSALFNGNNQHKLDLETFAIGAMFDRVIKAANLRFGPMTSHRYQMERDLDGGGRGRRGLGIQVFDIFTGKARPTATLSGGETFIAALALALGLADVVESTSGKVRLDTIFIDEGFGSLDTENGSGTLDQVLQVLNDLVSQNRAVGLISHVPLVQDAVPNGFYVRKQPAGSSVEARGQV